MSSVPAPPTLSLTGFGRALDGQLSAMCKLLSEQQDAKDLRHDAVHKLARGLQATHTTPHHTTPHHTANARVGGWVGVP